MIPLQVFQQAIVLNTNGGLGLIILGIILIAISVILQSVLPAGGKAWYALLVVGIVIVIVGAILLLFGLL